MRLVYRDNREWAEKCPGSVPFVKRSASRLSRGATSATKRLIRLAVAPDNTLPPPLPPLVSLSLSLSHRLSRHANCVQTNRRCADRRANTPALPRFPSPNLLLPSPLRRSILVTFREKLAVASRCARRMFIRAEIAGRRVMPSKVNYARESPRDYIPR